MKLVSDTPKSKARCIYKLEFPDGSFYIGSTIKFRQRMSGYKSAFKNSRGAVNMLISNKAREFNTATFNILLKVPEGVNLREAEDEYIKINATNPFLLNRSRSAFSNSGMIKKQVKYVV